MNEIFSNTIVIMQSHWDKIVELDVAKDSDSDGMKIRARDAATIWEWVGVHNFVLDPVCIQT